MSVLVKRLRGQYEVGPDAEFGERDFSDFIPPIHFEAADKIESLQAEIATLVEDLNYQQTISNAAQKELIALKPQWISVEDRLPELDLPVLLLTEVDGVITGWRDLGDTEFSDYRWVIGNSNFMWDEAYNLNDLEITHWMPLPPSPEAE